MKHRVGGYLNAKAGLRHVVLNARALGFDAVQTMTSATGSRYEAQEIQPKDAEEYRARTYGIATYVHLPFTINPCEVSRSRRGFYKKIIKDQLIQATMLGARAVVMHPGYKKENTEDEARRALIQFLEEILEEDPHLDVLLETDAGSKNGSAIGTPAFIRSVIDEVEHDRLGICADTCHLYARGINLWEPAVLEAFLKVYGRQVRLIHLNVPDKDVELGSFKDRHNTPFTDRPDLESTNLVRTLGMKYDLILERRSLGVQEQDVKYVRAVLEAIQPSEPKLVTEASTRED